MTFPGPGLPTFTSVVYLILSHPHNSLILVTGIVIRSQNWSVAGPRFVLVSQQNSFSSFALLVLVEDLRYLRGKGKGLRDERMKQTKIKRENEKSKSTFCGGGHLICVHVANRFFDYSTCKSTSLKLLLWCLSTGFYIMYQKKKKPTLSQKGSALAGGTG